MKEWWTEMKFFTRQTAFIMILLAVPLGAWTFVFKPRNADIAAARIDIDIKLAQLDDLHAIETINADLEQTLSELDSALEDLRARIPDAAAIEDVLRRIAEMATENQLVVRSFKRERAVPGAHYTEMPLATVIEGRFEGIHQFLHDLESMPRITRILNMSIEKPIRKSRSDSNLPRDHVKAEMTISIYADPSKGAKVR